MQARHDLRKFITELPVAQRGAVLSSGRELPVPGRPVRKSTQGGEMKTSGRVRAPGESDQPPRMDRGIANVGRLTPGAGIETSTQMGSVLMAAEALQEAETEVGTAVSVASEARVAGHSRSTVPVIDVGLTA
ncbi:hypothetical protein OWR29_38090 [Actinoplanes sp. Pm04-4]|uniref:Uncharacterized protein n=1 Tax=Paractinoplanes pyxinae TaxID=2997416 RepID=A0ABT4BBE7_9ACTN|nr:hypothetical protein [Actinoplanes pyxinae]MCY1143843.1 hypothetical protein [Actinoplanes pyxinae]